MSISRLCWDVLWQPQLQRRCICTALQLSWIPVESHHRPAKSQDDLNDLTSSPEHDQLTLYMSPVTYAGQVHSKLECEPAPRGAPEADIRQDPL